MNARRFAFTAWALAGAVGITAAVATAAGLRLNTTDSAPTGLWRIAPVDPAQIAHGSLVSICPPPLGVVVAMREGGYLHPGDCPDTNTTPLLKPVVAMAGDTVTVSPGEPLTVNGKPIPESAPETGMPAWLPGTYTVQPGEIWVISSYSSGSFDSRYFGPVAVKNLRGLAAPILVTGDVGSMTKGSAANEQEGG